MKRIKDYIKNWIQLVYLRCKSNGILPASTTIREGKYITLGDNYVIGENSKLMCWDKYTSGTKDQFLNPNLIIGDNFRATSELVIQCAGNIKIGNDVLVARNVFIIDYNHGNDPCTKNYLDNDLYVRDIEIEDGVWIGNNVIILAGVKIGRKSIIGAGSVVRESVEPYSVVIGNPARVVKKFNFISQKWERLSQ